MEQEELYRMINEKEGALSLAFPKLMRKPQPDNGNSNQQNPVLGTYYS